MKHIRLNYKIVLSLIIITGVIFRLWGINFGLPSKFHYDESTAIYGALFMGANRLRPHFYFFPALMYYLLLILFGIYFIFGRILGIWNSSFEFFVAYLRDPSMLLLIGRFFAASISTLLIALIYLAGKAAFNKKTGLIAALFFAVNLLAVQEAHYIKEDTLMGLFGILLYYFLIKDIAILKKTILLGITFGLASSLKYTFFIFTPLIVCGLIYTNRQIKLRKIIYYLILCFSISAIVFVMLNPYFFINLNIALKDLAAQSRLTESRWVNTVNQPIWLYYITYYLKNYLGVPLLITYFFSLCYSFIYKKKQILFLNIYILTFFLTVIFLGSTNFSRYLIWIIPSILITAAYLIALIRKRLVLMSLVSLLIIPSIFRIINFDNYLTLPDTRAISRNWVFNNIQANSKIVVEGAARSEYQSVYGPPLDINVSSLTKLIDKVNKNGGDALYLKALNVANQNKHNYDLLGIPHLDMQYDDKTASYSELETVDLYVQNRVCYLIASNWANGNKDKTLNTKFTKSLLANYRIEKQFIPTYYFPEDPVWRIDFNALDRFKISKQAEIGGPIITIYKANNDTICK